MSNCLTIWLLQTGEPLHIDSGNPRPMRAMNLANALVKEGHKVVIWSSCFYHQEKKHRANENSSFKVSESLEIRLVMSPGYKRNVGIGRLWDHAVMARNLTKLLKVESSMPDVAFVGYPPIEAAAVMTKWLTDKKIPFAIDVKDQWPVIFIEALPAPLKLIGRIALAPYYYYGRRSMKEANVITAMASGFLNWAATFAGRNVNETDLIVPLTSPAGQVSVAELDEAGRWWDDQGVRSDDIFKICFIGSHSRAFDMEPVYKAAKNLELLGIAHKFILCGNGEESAAWKRKMEGMPNIVFPGWVDRAKIEALAQRSHAALAPYHNTDDFIITIPNKVIDALALGLPVLSPLRGEVGELIVKNDVGLIYGECAGRSLESCIKDLVSTPEFQVKLSKNSKKLFHDKFSFEMVYGGLVRHLELLAKSVK